MKLLDVTNFDDETITIVADDISLISEKEVNNVNYTIIHFSLIEEDCIYCKEPKKKIIKKLKRLYGWSFKWK
jgi:hypothetical protein